MRTHRPGTFQGGHKKRGGRKKGTPNRLNRNLLEAMVKAAEKVGSDGRGKDGIDGYFERLAGKKEELFRESASPSSAKTSTGGGAT